MKKLAFAMLSLLSLSSCQGSAGPDVRDVWARDTIGRQANAAVFMTITSDKADRLVGASTGIAKKTDLMTFHGGSAAMRMSYVKAIDLPAGRPVKLDPAGLHVWLADLYEPLEQGSTFPLTLHFEKAGKQRVTVMIIAPSATPPGPGA